VDNSPGKRTRDVEAVDWRGDRESTEQLKDSSVLPCEAMQFAWYEGFVLEAVDWRGDREST